MAWKFRHYGRSYIYDRLHRGAVMFLMGLSGLAFIQVVCLCIPIVKKHAFNKVSTQIEGTPPEESNQGKNNSSASA